MNQNTWNIDASHSNIGFHVRHMVFAKVRGQFTSWRGAITMGPEGDADLTQAKVLVTIDAKSIDTATGQRDEHLRSADFLDVESYPELRFASTSVQKLGSDHYAVLGDLTIRDVTRPVTLDVHYTGRGQDPWGNQRVGFSATAEILRSEFGLTWNQALETGGVLVGDKLNLDLEIQAVRAAASEAA